MRFVPLLLIPAHALAQDPPPQEPPPAAPVKPLSAEDVATAPRPGEESGRLDPNEPEDGAGRSIARGLLWVPRLPVEAVIQPARGVMYLRDRYHVFSVVASWFTTEDKKITIYPTALIETGFGANAGVRAGFNDVLGAGERFKLRAGFGGRWRNIAELQLDGGKHRNRTISGGILLRTERRDRERFYGYGNAEEVDAPAMPVDPSDGIAVSTRYQLQSSRIAPHVRFALPSNVALTASAALLRDRIETVDMAELDEADRPIDTVYDTTKLPGFGVRDSIYSELEVAWDTRRPAHELDPPGMHGTGALVSGFAGRHIGLDDAPDFYRAGIDLQGYVPLTRGPRVLELRAYGEAVGGRRSQLPFYELPTLGGQRLLRGYDIDRFRDRVAAVGQAAYLFAFSHRMAGSLFVDAGRVYSNLDAVTLRDLNVGFGGAIEVYSRKSLVIRAELAFGLDGGSFAYVSLDPAFDNRARTDRR